MRLSEKIMLRSLLFAAPIVLSSTVAIAPSRAASFASAAASLTLENFTLNGTPLDGNTPLTDAVTFTDTTATDGTANSDANAQATVTLTQLQQSSDATVSGSGRNYSANALGASFTQLAFNPGCGCFRFDFQSQLDAIARLTNPTPGETAAATSFVGFSVFDGSQEIDKFEATLTAGNPFNIVSTPYIYFTSLPDLSKSADSAWVNGYYERHFAEGTQLTVQGRTLTAAVATVPEPPMFAALVILPGLIWLKRRKAKAIPQVAVSHDRRSE
jgi:hypothetical protein